MINLFLQTIHNEPLQEAYRHIMKAFYGVLKSADRYLRFVFLTGVTKFAQVSVFSDLNQLNDISLDYDYATLCGITHAELVDNLTPELEQLGQMQSLSRKGPWRQWCGNMTGIIFIRAEKVSLIHSAH